MVNGSGFSDSSNTKISSLRRRGENVRKRRTTTVIIAATLILVLILMPISRISRTDRFSTSQTRTVAQTLSPPPIVAFLESADCQVTLIEHLPNLTADARIMVYDQNGNITYQSSLFEEFPELVKRNYNFTVINSGTYNITLENAGVFFVKLEAITTIWNDVVTYPFEPLFYIGLAIAAVGLLVTCTSLLKRQIVF